MSESKNKVKLFEGQQVRHVWDEEAEKWWISVVDVVAILTDSVDPTAYWRKLKQRLIEEGNETVTNCHQLKLLALDGKLRLTDVADTEQILRLIQSIPSKKAEEEIISRKDATSAKMQFINFTLYSITYLLPVFYQQLNINHNILDYSASASLRLCERLIVYME